ncbi:imm11 family protein [Pseudovibrio axinellae]|nr:DUF1629 domain-containing protein [Pseudovibrio axinellae]
MIVYYSPTTGEMMPFVIRGTNIADDAIVKDFYPALPVEQARPFILGTDFTQEEIDQLPRTHLVEKPAGGKPQPDMMGWNFYPPVIAPVLKDFIETLEPGVHEFVPVEVKRDDGSQEFGTYYLMLVRQTSDALLFDETNWDGGQYGYEAARKERFLISHFHNPVLRALACAGLHIWRGTGKLVKQSFCSDEVGQFIKEKGLRGWYLQPCQMHP